MIMNNTEKYLLKVDDLKTYFPIRKGLLRKTTGFVRAVDGVSFKIRPGQTLGLVGESGCGKTTTARTLIRLLPATAGRIFFDGMDVFSADKKQLRQLRRDVSIIFQDPFSSLNPRMTVGDIVGEPLKVHKKISGGKLVAQVMELLVKVGLSADHINRYPHEFSGGQRQRIGIARALSLEPKLVICDEPVSALDVSIQSQVLNLLKDMQDEFSLTYLFIAHDLAVVEFFCDVVAVMYMGKIVEQATAEQLYKEPLHPYTKMLITAIPEIEPSRRNKNRQFAGQVPENMDIPRGCRFHPRCPLADEDCLKHEPLLLEKKGDKNHFVSCWKC